VMMAPIIPGLNMSEIPSIAAQAAKAGALNISHTILRLNGEVEQIFKTWLSAVYPDRAEKVLNQVQSIHGGKVGDSRFMKRMLGEGRIAEMVSQMMKVARDKNFESPGFPEFNLSRFRRGGMYTIW